MVFYYSTTENTFKSTVFGCFAKLCHESCPFGPISYSFVNHAILVTHFNTDKNGAVTQNKLLKVPTNNIVICLNLHASILSYFNSAIIKLVLVQTNPVVWKWQPDRLLTDAYITLITQTRPQSVSWPMSVDISVKSGKRVLLICGRCFAAGTNISLQRVEGLFLFYLIEYTWVPQTQELPIRDFLRLC